MPALPKKITVDRKAKKLYIDGAEFPWHITADGPEVDGVCSQHEIPRVTVTMHTEDLEIIPEA